MNVDISDDDVVEVEETFLIYVQMAPGLDPRVHVYDSVEITIIDNDRE